MVDSTEFVGPHLDESEPEISGTLGDELRQVVKENFDQLVTATLAKRTVRLPVDEAETVTCSLLAVRPIDESPGQAMDFGGTEYIPSRPPSWQP